jgi:hypothetical protein
VFDHVTIRVSDRARFYEAVAPHAGIRLGSEVVNHNRS